MEIRLAAKLSYDSIVDGPGLRIVIWSQGCLKNCKNCHNPQTHDLRGGFLSTTETILKEIKDYPLCKGVTFSGGEPFLQPEAFIEIAKNLKENGYNLWSFSGYKYEELYENVRTRKLLELLDVLVDGEYIDDLKDPLLIFRGSTNQRIIDVQKSLISNSIIEYQV